MVAFTVLVAFREAEIDDVDVVPGWLCVADQKVVGFDVSMNDALLMDFLYSLNELYGNLDNC